MPRLHNTSFEMYHIANGVLSGILKVDGCNDDELDVILTDAQKARIDDITNEIVEDHLLDMRTQMHASGV